MAPKPVLPPRHCDIHTRHTGKCEGCRKARSVSEAFKKRTGIQPRLPALGTRRRLEALQRLGYGPTEVGRMLGMSKGNVQRVRFSQRWVSHDMAERIDALYRKLENTPANAKHGLRRQIIRTKAKQNGLAPPMAWDNIDRDPEPTGVVKRPAFVRVNEKLAEAAFLKSFGLTDEVIATRLGVSLATLRRWDCPSNRERRGAA